ncbi:MAG: acetate kinase [Verrucomicrobiaceae bacterium]|nr:acetate kinase [Verrucomicrobiaceae bacterium]
MKRILIANVGSTSYKYTLFDASADGTCNELVRGGMDRVSDYETAIKQSLEDLQAKGYSQDGIDAVAFKTVLGKDVSGLREGDEVVLKALEDMSFVAPAHNPPYAAAIRAFGKVLPTAKKVVLFETSFYQWADKAWKRYAVPQSWDKIGIRRNGFHGASHKFAAERAAELCGRADAAESAKMLYVNNAPAKLEKPFRLINCHLGGSSSICGILNGAAVGASMGFSPQSGLPQNNRVGDLDSTAIPYAMATLGISAEEAMRQLSKEGGLLGISGVSNDMRDLVAASNEGNENAKLAIDVLIYNAQAYIGQFMVLLGGVDAICFSGGIAENNPWLRKAILEPLKAFGLELDDEANNKAVKKDAVISSENSKIKAVTAVANEELVIVREAAKYLEK